MVIKCRELTIKRLKTTTGKLLEFREVAEQSPSIRQLGNCKPQSGKNSKKCVSEHFVENLIILPELGVWFATAWQSSYEWLVMDQ